MRFSDLRRVLRARLRPGPAERDLHDELTSHVEFEIDKLVRSGMPREQARRTALARFGSLPATAEACREARGKRYMSEVAADLRFGIRQFRSRPFVTAAMVAVLAIGIGFATTIFVLITSFTSAPLAGVDADAGAVRIRGIDRSRGPGRAIGREFTYAEVQEYAARQDVFAAVAAWTSTDVVLDVGDGISNLQSGAATFVTSAYFDALGVPVVRGAGLPASFADGGDPIPAGIISHAVWTRFYDVSEAVIGRTIGVNGAAITIAGVAPEGFVGARPGGSEIRVWLPLNARRLVQPSMPGLESEAAIFGVISRLQPGVTPDQATAAVSTIAARYSTHGADQPGRPRDFSADVVPVLASNYFPPSGEPSSLTGPLLSLTMPLLVLLITCTSVSALLAGQALGRRREIAVRLAIGAHRQRIVRQLLTETGVLGLGAATLALCVVWWMLAGAGLALFGTGVPLVVDWRAIAFAATLALVASLAFGLSPALHATRTTVSDVLKEGDTARKRTRLQTTLVIAQIALTQPALLMMGALLLELRTELNERAPATAAGERIVEVGFNTNPRYSAIDERREQTIARIRKRIASLPGVAGTVPRYLGDGRNERVTAHPDDRADGQPGVLSDPVLVRPAPDGFFAVMGLSLAEGRGFGSADQSALTTAIVNRELARRMWGTAPAVGRRLVLAENARGGPIERTLTVIGVVDGEATPQLYLPVQGDVTSHLVVRTHGPAEDSLPAIRAAALQEAPEMPITSARTLASIDAEARRWTLRGVFAAGVSGSIALLLAAVGLYAVVAVAVVQRRREIAVRDALGADRRAIIRLFVRRGLGICLTGAAIGLGASVLAMKVMAEIQAFGQQTGPVPNAGLLAGVTLFVMTVALIASWLPARRAASIAPVSVLRAE